MRCSQTKNTAILSMTLLLTASFVAAPGAVADHERGHTLVEAGPVRVDHNDERTMIGADHIHVYLDDTRVEVEPGPARVVSEDGYMEHQAGPVRVELQRLGGFQGVTATPFGVNLPIEKVGEIAVVAVTIQGLTSQDNTTFTSVSFGIHDACENWMNLPLVQECSKVPGTTTPVSLQDPEVDEDPWQFCIYNQKITVDIHFFQPFFTTDDLKEPVQGTCP